MERKFEEDFKEWVRNQKEYPHHYNPYSILNDWPLSMQWGVYVDFLLEQSMYIHIRQVEGRYSVYIDWHGHHLLITYLIKDSLKEARESALEKAIEIYNQKQV